jgi:hypothetical protein
MEHQLLLDMEQWGPEKDLCYFYNWLYFQHEQLW